MQQYQPFPRNYVTNCVFPCYKFEKIESIYLLYMMNHEASRSGIFGPKGLRSRPHGFKVECPSITTVSQYFIDIH